MSRAADITAQLIAALKQSGLAGQQVTGSRRQLRRYATYPAIGVFRLQDVPTGAAVSIGREARQLSLELRLLNTGAVAEDATDDLHESVNLLVHQTLAALGTLETGGVEWNSADENPALGICRAQYHITYHRMEGEL